MYDIYGSEIITLVESHQPSGYYQVYWDGNDKYDIKVGSGIYIYKLQAGGFSTSKTMIILK